MSLRVKSRRRVAKETGEKSMTKQEFVAQCDVNNIMKKYKETGLLDHVNRYQGSYGEFADAPDYHTALNKMHEADAMFMGIPSDIREVFDNDPGKFLEFVMNEENEDEMRDLGLLPRQSVEKEEQEPAPPAKAASEAKKQGEPVKAAESGEAKP